MNNKETARLLRTTAAIFSILKETDGSFLAERTADGLTEVADLLEDATNAKLEEDDDGE